MKSFIATTLAATALAATETKSWSGTKVTGDITCTPKGSSSYDGTKTDITVTYKTTATLGANLAKGKKCQAWWCEKFDANNTHCQLWQFEQKDTTKTELKGRVYAYKGLPSFDATKKNAKDAFDESSNVWKKNSAITYKKTGSAATTASEATVGLYTPFNISGISGKTATGVFKRTFTGATATTMKKGTAHSGMIGAYVSGGKGSKKEVTVGVKAATVPKVAAAKTTKGAKKTWTGPNATVGDITGTAGGYTEWSKFTAAGNTSQTLTSWMCQSITMNKAPEDSDFLGNVWLSDKAATPTVELWEMGGDQLKLRKYKLAKAFAPKEGDSESPKNVVDEGTKIMHENYFISTGTVEKGTTNIETTRTGVSGFVRTGCSQSSNSDKASIKTAVKGSSKVYQQGIWLAADKDEEEQGKLATSDVTVVIAAEGGASSLLTALGAVAVGVAALAF